jgi:hypothetical protein
VIDNKHVCVIVPVYNEEGNVEKLHHAVQEVIKENNILSGGLLTDDNDYYLKYLKYKNKYLNLKKMKNI